MQQRGRLAGALPAADHGDAFSAIAFGIGMLAGMADQRARQAVELRRPVFMAEQAGGHHHALGEKSVAVFQHQAETAIERLHAGDRAGIEIGRNVLLKPEAVTDEIFHRQELGHVHARLPVIRVERQTAARIGDMRSGPGRAQFHAGRHIRPPERQRIAEDADRDIRGAQMRGGGEAVGAGADDRNGGTIVGLNGIDGNIHGHFLCVSTWQATALSSPVFLSV